MAFFRDQPALAIDGARYAGEVIAAVAAEDEDAAQQAIERIVVDYEELPGVFDVMEAVVPGAPLITRTRCRTSARRSLAPR